MAKNFVAPNHTQTPNIFFDDSLPKIKSFAELKVILAIVRQTFGWHKPDDRISISQLVKLTGLTRQGVVNGVARALEDGFLDRQPVGQSFTYSLKVVNEVDQFQVQTSQQDRPELVNQVDRQLVNEVDPQKKESKEKKEIEPALPFSSKAFLEAWDDYTQARKEKRQTVTPTIQKVLCKKMDSWGEARSIAALIHSTGYTGLFEPHAGKPDRDAPLGYTENGTKIVADHGDWFEVEASQGGGTSPRYRTAEAFARQTGRSLEEVGPWI